ncbi:hypothetical protein CKM354_000067100 [Cercospora kikuchii]|uniref:F-box domain-containing protein n=1 Tax=Cercospora kikuchii TaxID=84275 RepID=A0A9P3FB74_9PEZI|nr:uncharacterized protein CKM354_000067100 [Cercospora kikuchii]GIZ37217.1 hypothetical protein CKM354_000067100 [Cercospora kikuchii]
MATPPPASTDVSLLGLPQELLVRVATFLTTEELNPLRCSCKHIERQLFDTFAREFFTKRQFMVEHESLEALMGISKHPGLASKLTDVIIDLRILDPNRWLDDRRLRSGHVNHRVLVHTGMARDMLVEVFSNLPNLRTIGLRDYDGAGRVREGERACWRPWGWSINRSTLVRCDSSEPILPLVLRSAGEAQARPTNVEVFLRRRALQADSFQCCHGRLGSDVIPVLKGLKTLMLAISSDGSLSSNFLGGPGSPYDEKNAAETTIRRFLHHTTNLESLRLNFVVDEFLGFRTIDWLGRTGDVLTPNPQIHALPVPPLQLQSLRSLDLGMANATAGGLVRVLSKIDLESFSLWKMTLQTRKKDHTSEDGWSHFLSQLSTRLPSSSGLRNIMIGYGSQAYYLGEIRYDDTDARVFFIPEGKDPADLAKAEGEQIVNFKAQYTGTSVHQWLHDMSKRAVVSLIHRNVSDDESVDDSMAEDSEDLDEDGEE